MCFNHLLRYDMTIKINLTCVQTNRYPALFDSETHSKQNKDCFSGKNTFLEEQLSAFTDHTTQRKKTGVKTNLILKSDYPRRKLKTFESSTLLFLKVYLTTMQYSKICSCLSSFIYRNKF